MAKIIVLGVSKKMIDTKLMLHRFGAHLRFNSQELLDKAVKLGFDKEFWEKRNYPNKVEISK